MTPIAGRLSDVYGKKKMLLKIVGIYTIGICVAAISTNFTVMIIARIMQGVNSPQKNLRSLKEYLVLCFLLAQ